MAHPLLDIITSPDPAVRDQPLEAWAAAATRDELRHATRALDRFRRESQNLYQRVRALFFLAAIHRYHLPPKLACVSAPSGAGVFPYRAYEHLLQRRFEEAIDLLLASETQAGSSDAMCSALCAAYQRLAFQTLADQVRRSVRSVRGNQWMFRIGHPADHPLRLKPELTLRSEAGTFPILREETPVRMDLTHCGWSDIFFLGMDYPEGARVLNVSIDLGIHGRDAAPRPPVSACLRIIEEPVLRLTSVDLACTRDITTLAEVFDFAQDHLGLLKAALIASGIVPPGMEGSGQSLADLLARLIAPGRGLELVSCVNDIPKGSRLAVSTNLLGSLIAVCMRATGQTRSLTGGLEEPERRIVLARALLGEWLGGSGGGWQDSGGIWPGIKLITGCAAEPDDPESGVSRGRLMPRHQVLDRSAIPEAARRALQDSLVLVHGGMAQNVGPVLEMVTEKYLLRSASEWNARAGTLALLQEILVALGHGDIRAVGAATTRNFEGPLQAIIPWASNHFTERLIARARETLAEDFWGFWMLGGMSGGGMGFIVAPQRKADAQRHLAVIMTELKRELHHSLPFAMDPVVFDYAINERGTWAELLAGTDALLPAGYYSLLTPALLRRDLRHLTPALRAELDLLGAACRVRPDFSGMVEGLFSTLLPRDRDDAGSERSLRETLDRNGFDRAYHEQIRTEMRDGRIGLAQNRLRADTSLEDVRDSDVIDLRTNSPESETELAAGRRALSNGELAVITLAAGAGSRWTQGAGVCKALHPFSRFAGRHRTFLEVHFAKTARRSAECGTRLPHVVTTSYLTHEPIAQHLARLQFTPELGAPLLSPGRAIGLRMVPMERDLRFLWEETLQQVLDIQQQKVRESLHQALIQWARTLGEGSDYIDNVPLQCMHPVGHFYEVPNLLRNGTLAQLLHQQPNLQHLLLHNVDTLGADADPRVLGRHLASGATLSFEVISRRLEDRGGGLARVNGRPRLVEGLAMPREEDEFRLRYYNSMTTWICIDGFLDLLGVSRDDVLASGIRHDAEADRKIALGIRNLASRLPTYLTLKDVKKRWGHGQEDVFPVAQFEKLWSDLSALPDLAVHYLLVSRLRGQQLKDPAQLDGWLRDGSASHVDGLCRWPA